MFDVGLNATRHAQLVRWCGLTAAQHDLVEPMRALLVDPNLDAIVASFYERVGAHRETMAIIGDPNRLRALERTQREYLCSLGRGFDQPEYYERRLRIGIAHARVGLSSSLFQLSAGWLRDAVIDSVPPARWLEARPLIKLLDALMRLDVAIALEAYHHRRIDALRASVRTLEDRVRTDPLTGCASRDYTQEHLDRISVSASKEAPIAVVMVDVDHFKRVNDGWGHAVGDQVLHEIAVRLRACVRSGDLVGRWGGEEFLVLLQVADHDEALGIAERMRLAVCDHPVTSSGGDLEVSVSQGVAIGHGDTTGAGLVERADAAMYESKRAGRNRVQVAAS